MKNEIEFVRNKIKEKGFMSETKITLELIQRKNSASKIKRILRAITSQGFHKLKYTNRYVSQYTTKVLFYYNPNVKYKKSKEVR